MSFPAHVTYSPSCGRGDDCLSRIPTGLLSFSCWSACCAGGAGRTRRRLTKAGGSNFSTGIMSGAFWHARCVRLDPRKQELRVAGQLFSESKCRKRPKSSGGFLRWRNLQPRKPASRGRDICGRHGRGVPNRSRPCVGDRSHHQLHHFAEGKSHSPFWRNRADLYRHLARCYGVSRIVRRREGDDKRGWIESGLRCCRWALLPVRRQGADRTQTPRALHGVFRFRLGRPRVQFPDELCVDAPASQRPNRCK